MPLRNKNITNKIIYCFALLIILTVMLIAACKNNERYKKEIDRKGIPYSIESFLNRVEVGNKEIIELFINAGMNVNTKGNYGETALMLASVHNNIEMIKFLIEKGADINAKSNDGYTPLMFASTQGLLDVVKLLIENGANVNAQNNDGETALMLASLNDRFGAVKLLIKKGADVSLKNNAGDTALEYAYLNTQIKELLRKAMAEKEKK
jgi:ankyrin repeat protein